MSARRQTAEISCEALFRLDEGLARQHEHWTAEGYSLTSGRLWRCKDGSWTARLVWRNPKSIVRTVTYVLRGLGSLVAKANTP